MISAEGQIPCYCGCFRFYIIPVSLSSSFFVSILWIESILPLFFLNVLRIRARKEEWNTLLFHIFWKQIEKMKWNEYWKRFVRNQKQSSNSFLYEKKSCPCYHQYQSSIPLHHRPKLRPTHAQITHPKSSIPWYIIALNSRSSINAAAVYPLLAPFYNQSPSNSIIILMHGMLMLISPFRINPKL